MTNAQEIQENEKLSWNVNGYFAFHPELFTTSIHPTKMVIALAGTLFTGAINYVLWFQSQIIQSTIDTKMWILRIVATIGLLYFLLLIVGAKKYADKISGGTIDTEYLQKYFPSEYQDALADFEAKNLDEILKLPAISWYHTAQLDRHLLSVAHNAEARKFYCFLSFENLETKETETAMPIIVTDREYERLLPIMEANKIAVKQIANAEEKDESIAVTPKI